MNCTNFSGDAWLEHSHSRSQCFLRGYLCACLYQSWLFNCPECYQFSWRRCHSLVLFRDYQLPYMEAALWSASTITTLVAREIWTRHQHYRCAVLDSFLVLPLMAILQPGNCRKYELGFCNICWHYCLCTYLLRCDWQVSLYRTCGADKTRRVKCI